VEGLLKASRVIDAINDRFGVVAIWLVLISCLVSTGNALSRHALTLKLNEHVRVDLIYSSVSERARLFIDLFGGLFFLLPICLILVYFTWPFFLDSWRISEMSQNAGGLIRWPVKLLLPVGFALMALQGLSEIIKRFAALSERYRIEYRYEKPPQ
jgi:TRAP-type mannitol/chloroaromatic compound transport system permease small subunit